MLEVTNTNRQVQKINKKLEKETLEPVDVQVLITLITSLQDKLKNIKAEEHPVKAQCNSIKRAFRNAIGWKDIPLLNKAAVQVNNLIVIATEVVQDPKKAQADIGSWGDIRGNLATLYNNLIDALTATIQEVKDQITQKKLKQKVA